MHIRNWQSSLVELDVKEDTKNQILALQHGFEPSSLTYD